jgi:hypothetical protein
MRPAERTIGPMVEVKRKPVIILVVALTAAAIIGVLNGGLSPIGAPAAADTELLPSTHSVVVTLTGEGIVSADVTMQVGSNTTQETVDMPMAEKRFSLAPDTIVVITAQMSSGSGGLACEITSDGVSLSTSTADTEYGVVTCSGSA